MWLYPPLPFLSFDPTAGGIEFPNGANHPRLWWHGRRWFLYGRIGRHTRTCPVKFPHRCRNTPGWAERIERRPAKPKQSRSRHYDWPGSPRTTATAARQYDDGWYESTKRYDSLMILDVFDQKCNWKWKQRDKVKQNSPENLCWFSKFRWPLAIVFFLFV